MQIRNHRLEDGEGNPVKYQETPNKSGGTITPRYVIIHYTAGASLGSSVNWLTNPAAKASAHLVVGRDGDVVQLARFNRKTWHAGRSRWGDVIGLNSHSIGIELDNAGVLTQRADGSWVTSFGRTIASEEVVVARHKNAPEGSSERGWHAYTEDQLDTLKDILAAISQKYEIEEILGHDDIAPERKSDPGPAFPMTSVQARHAGRDNDDEPDPFDGPVMGPV